MKKKICALVLAFSMVLGLAATASAAELSDWTTDDAVVTEQDGKFTVQTKSGGVFYSNCNVLQPTDGWRVTFKINLAQGEGYDEEMFGKGQWIQIGPSINGKTYTTLLLRPVRDNLIGLSIIPESDDTLIDGMMVFDYSKVHVFEIVKIGDKFYPCLDGTILQAAKGHTGVEDVFTKQIVENGLSEQAGVGIVSSLGLYSLSDITVGGISLSNEDWELGLGAVNVPEIAKQENQSYKITTNNDYVSLMHKAPQNPENLKIDLKLTPYADEANSYPATFLAGLANDQTQAIYHVGYDMQGKQAIEVIIGKKSAIVQTDAAFDFSKAHALEIKLGDDQKYHMYMDGSEVTVSSSDTVYKDFEDLPTELTEWMKTFEQETSGIMLAMAGIEAIEYNVQSSAKPDPQPQPEPEPEPEPEPQPDIDEQPIENPKDGEDSFVYIWAILAVCGIAGMAFSIKKRVA